MNFLSNLLGKTEGKKDVEATAEVTCSHSVLLPRWNSVEAMGREDEIASFNCEACHEPFTAESGRAHQVLLARRLRDLAQTGI